MKHNPALDMLPIAREITLDEAREQLEEWRAEFNARIDREMADEFGAPPENFWIEK